MSFTRPKFFKRRWFRVTTICLFISFLPTFVIIISRTWLTEHSNQKPSVYPANPIVLEKQTESHTCGMHALHSIYRAYGMEPRLENIRYRLGTDFYALVWLRSSTGTFQADMQMVLEQDHFDVIHGSEQRSLKDHLDSGHLAAVLIKRPESGGLHWVVAAPPKSGALEQVQVFDSLKEQSEQIGLDVLNESIVSVMTVKPSVKVRGKLSSVGSLISGSLELVRSIPKM